MGFACVRYLRFRDNFCSDGYLLWRSEAVAIDPNCSPGCHYSVHGLLFCPTYSVAAAVVDPLARARDSFAGVEPDRHGEQLDANVVGANPDPVWRIAPARDGDSACDDGQPERSRVSSARWRAGRLRHIGYPYRIGASCIGWKKLPLLCRDRCWRTCRAVRQQKSHGPGDRLFGRHGSRRRGAKTGVVQPLSATGYSLVWPCR
jgi:hypothetical protein